MSVLKDFEPEFEYAEECYQYLIQREKRRPIFHNRSPQLQYREQLIKRIQILCFLNKLSVRVKYLSVYIMDFFMDNHDVNEDSIELLLVSCLLIAAKVEENDNKIPKFRQLVSDPKQYLRCEALDMETKILQFFNWDFLTPTAATYIDYFYVKCLPKSAVINSSRVLVDKYLDKIIETRFYRFNPSLIAASIIFCVRDRLGLDSIWPQTAQAITKYTFGEMENCIFELRKYEIILTPMKKLSHPSVNQLNVSPLNDSGISDCDKC